jgi:hypothetical protein
MASNEEPGIYGEYNASWVDDEGWKVLKGEFD